jgi:hypothetical protein
VPNHSGETALSDELLYLLAHWYSTQPLLAECPMSNLDLNGRVTRFIPMTKNEVNRFRSILLARQAELEHAIRDREALAIDPSPDELDRIQHATERDMAIGQSRAPIRPVARRASGAPPH